MTVDLELELVVSGVMLAGGEIANLLAAGEFEDGTRWEIDLGPLEDFLGSDAARFDVMDDVINREALGLS